ncbi:MAG: tetratricopeptide repeat protein, partial [Candidatus Omnitrophica bacterium]|nr:tetratricopeptide repeat protein [Candidatus Omnitrophota bacterium]
SLILGILTLSFYPIILNYFTHGASISGYIARQAPYLASYLKFVFFPQNIHFYYSFPPLRQVFGSSFEFQTFAFIGCFELLAMIYALSRRKKAGFWILWFFIFIAPVIALPIPLATQHLYLAMIGQIGLVLCLLEPLKRLGFIMLLGLAMILSPLAYTRLSLWENAETLWKDLLPVQSLDQKQLWWLAGHDPNRIPLRKTMKKALTNLAYYYENNGQSDKAAMLYDTLTKFMPKFREAYINLATIYLSSSDPDGIRKAEEVVARFHAKNPGATPLYSILASIAHRNDEVDNEIKYLQQALDAGEKNAGVYFNLGLTHARKRDFEKAVTYFKQGMAMDEHLPEIRFYLGLTLMRTEKWQEALQIFKTMLQEKMEVEGIYFQMGYAYLKLDHQPQARKMYLLSIAKQPQISQAYYHLGLMAMQDGQLHQAKGYLEQAVEQQPDSPIYRIQLSKITETLAEQSRSTTQASR